jgi:photosystem II stability/assembly factor-like uncharacterized protein
MIACLSPNGQNSRFGGEAPTRLLVATVLGVNVLDRERPGAPWRARRTLDGHHCGSIMIEPRRGGVFAGMHSGGLYYSADGGATWELRNAGITIPHVFSLGFAHVGDQIRLYAGTEPASIFRSDDYGLTWTEQPGVKNTEGREAWRFPGKDNGPHVKSMFVDPNDQNIIYLGVEQGDVLKTTDGGANYRVLDDYSKPEDWTYRDIHQIVVNYADSNEIFMSTGMGVYHSTDAGETWKLIIDHTFPVGYPDHFFISPLDNDTMFISGASSNPGTWRKTHRADPTVMKSTDHARTWHDASTGLPEDRRANFEAMSLAGYPGAFSLFVGTTDGEVYESDDQGGQWTHIASDLGAVSKIYHYKNLQLVHS